MGTHESGRSGITRGANETDENVSSEAAETEEQRNIAAPPTLRDPDAQVIWEAEDAARKAEAQKIVTLIDYVHSRTEKKRREVRADYESMQAREAAPAVLQLWAQQSEYAVHDAENAAIMYAAEALNLSEYHVSSLYVSAQRARNQLPRVWRAFRAGRITVLALRSITRTLDKTTKDGTVEKLDDQAPEYAQHHRPGQLNDWLRRFIAKVEPTDAAERFTRAAKERFVSVRDLEDGMSMLTAIMPTLTAHNIQEKLEAVARSPKRAVPHNPLIATQIHEQEQRIELGRALHQWMRAGRSSQEGEPTLLENWEIGQAAQHLARELQDNSPSTGQIPFTGGLHIIDGAPIGHSEGWSHESPGHEDETDNHDAGRLPETRADGDPRNIRQRALDIFTAWLLEGDSATSIRPETHIGILVHEATLVGTSDEPAVTRDGRGIIPAPHMRDMLRASDSSTKWCELGTAQALRRTPDDGANTEHPNILSYRSSGRFPPPRLRAALEFRDGVCAADGCRVPAERCDVDHIIPWPQGRTNAENLQVLCRRHHRLKTAGYDIGSRYTQAA